MNNLKIGVKLIGGFVLTALLLVTIVFVIFMQIGNLRKLQDQGARQASNAIATQEMAGMGNKLYRTIADAEINRDLNATKKAWSECKSEMDSDFSNIEKMATNSNEREWAAQVKKAYQELVDRFENQMLPLISEAAKGNSKAEEMMRELDNKLDDDINGMNEPMDKFTEALKAENEKGDADFDKASQATITLSIIIAIIGVVLSLLIGIFLSLSITGPLQKGVNMMLEMAKGHLGTRLNMKRKDEIGVLAGAMDVFSEDLQNNIVATVKKIGEGDISTEIKPKDNMDEITPAIINATTAIRNLIEEATTLSKAAVEGRINTRGDVSKYKGGYREIVQGVNDTIDSLVGLLDVMPAPAMIIDKDFTIQYMNKVGASLGKMDQKQVIGTKCYNFFKTTDCNTERCACGKAIRGGQTASSETVAKPSAGTFEIDYTGVPIKDKNGIVVGAFEVVSDQTSVKKAARVADKISKYTDNEVQKVAKCLDQLSNGDLNFTVSVAESDADTSTVCTQFTTITGAISKCQNAVTALVSDVDMLSKAAVEGKLATRADASRHQGDFRKIVQGVDDTLDAVIIPINEAADVLDKVSNRDLTARVKGDYKGDLAKIKNAINTAVDNLDSALTQVSEATEQVSSASEQISSGSQSLAQGANEQASSLEEVSSSLEEMSSMTKQNAGNANEARNLAGEANNNAKTGTEAMQRMSQSINRIKESSDQTAKIVKTIDEIAMQTNLLALNAAVEAARAGEAGRGFAVVAEEVRNLAQRSAQAAKNTADMITESVKNADDGVKIAVEVSKSFELIATSAKKVNDLISEIAVASQEQSQGIEQVNNAVAQMDKVTQQNAANSEESASAAEELSSQSRELQSMIEQFKINSSVESKYSGQKFNSINQFENAASEKSVHKKAAARYIGDKRNGNGKHSQEKVLAEAKRIAPKKKTEIADAEALFPMNDDAIREF